MLFHFVFTGPPRGAQKWSVYLVHVEALSSVPEQPQEQIASSLSVIYWALVDIARDPLGSIPLIPLEPIQPLPADSLPYPQKFPIQWPLIA